MKNKIGKDKTTMTAREVGVLIEGLRSDFRVFGDELSTIKNRLDMLFEELGKHKEEIFIIKADIRIIKTDIAEIKESLKDHSKRLSHLEAIK